MSLSLTASACRPGRPCGRGTERRQPRPQLPPDAPEGLCAACLLTAGTETLTGSSDATSTGVASAADSSRPGAPRLVDGQVWGPVSVVRLLGRGGMGEVLLEAEHLESGRRLALKVLRQTLRGAEDRARFLREGRLAASMATRTPSRTHSWNPFQALRHIVAFRIVA